MRRSKYDKMMSALDNLNIARQMEERGDSALDIRMATGWERGKDGKWRYEINDGVFLLCLLLIVVCYDCVTKDDSMVDLIDYGKRSDFSYVFTLLYNVLIYRVLGSI